MNSPKNHFEGNYNSNTLTVIICSTLAFYNAVELQVLIFTTFHAYRGLYFWSLFIASFGIVPYVIGYNIEYFQLSWMAMGITIDTIGWILMVSGQSFVLYSRLWIVSGLGHHRLLTAVKWMIIIDGSVFHGTTAGMYIADSTVINKLQLIVYPQLLYTVHTTGSTFTNLAQHTTTSSEYKCSDSASRSSF
jgi:hypothetical protein